MEAILNTLIKAIGWSIFHSLWQGAVVYGTLFLILSAFPKLRASVKHNLAFGGICLLFLVFCITFFLVLKIPVTGSIVNVPVTSSFAEPASYFSMLQYSVFKQAESVFPYMVGLYAAGLIVQIILISTGYNKLNKLKGAQHNPVPEQWNELFQRIILKLQIGKQVNFFLSEHVNVPLVIGYFKPVVLFPIALAAQLEMKQVEAILIHELSHIRRNDYLLNLLKTGIETILFFNPFVWLSSRYIAIEREHACDDLVLGYTGTPLTYAHALLKLELLKVKDTPTLSLAASGRSQHLYQRIKRITDMKTNYMNPKQQIFAITFTLATIMSLAWISPKEKKTVQTVETHIVQKIKRTPRPDQIQPERKVTKVVRMSLPIDTPKKKKKVKIITVDEQGKKTEYKSINELPDSIKDDLDNRDVYVTGLSSVKLDTARVLELKKTAEAFALKFNSPEEKAKWNKLGIEMRKQGEEFQKKFNSPEEKAKWDKLSIEMRKQGEEFQKKFNSPEEKAKWEKLRIEMRKQGEAFQKKFNSPEEKAKWRKLTAEMQKHAAEMSKHALLMDKHLNSMESQKQFQKLNEQLRLKTKEMNNLMITPEIKKQIEGLTFSTKEPD
jgi:bla regulator protein BlaR1